MTLCTFAYNWFVTNHLRIRSHFIYSMCSMNRINIGHQRRQIRSTHTFICLLHFPLVSCPGVLILGFCSSPVPLPFSFFAPSWAGEDELLPKKCTKICILDFHSFSAVHRQHTHTHLPVVSSKYTCMVRNMLFNQSHWFQIDPMIWQFYKMRSNIIVDRPLVHSVHHVRLRLPSGTLVVMQSDHRLRRRHLRPWRSALWLPFWSSWPVCLSSHKSFSGVSGPIHRSVRPTVTSWKRNKFEEKVTGMWPNWLTISENIRSWIICGIELCRLK